MTHRFDVEEVVDFDDDFTETADVIYARCNSARIAHIMRALAIEAKSHPHSVARSCWNPTPRPDAPPYQHIADYHIHKANDMGAFMALLQNSGQLSDDVYYGNRRTS